jgi:hypothetical protein
MQIFRVAHPYVIIFKLQVFFWILELFLWKERRTVGHQLDDLLMSCQFSGSDCILVFLILLL